MKHKRLLVALLGLLALLATFWVLTGVAPSWYAPIDVGDADTEAASERVEFRIQQELQRLRPKSPRWTLRLPDDIANAWLATRLNPWLRGQDIDWPQGVGVPQVRCRTGVLEIAAPLDSLGGRVGRLDLIPRVDAQGLRLTQGWAAIGALPLALPAELILTDEFTIPLIHTSTDGVITLIDQRTVRIAALRPVAGAIEVDLVTMDRAAP